jgi:hypothetical protein
MPDLSPEQTATVTKLCNEAIAVGMFISLNDCGRWSVSWTQDVDAIINGINEAEATRASCPPIGQENYWTFLRFSVPRAVTYIHYDAIGDMPLNPDNAGPQIIDDWDPVSAFEDSEPAPPIEEMCFDAKD